MLIIQTFTFILLPSVVAGVTMTEKGHTCLNIGNFVWCVSAVGVLLLVSYCWGRYYSNKLDYARTIQILLETADEKGSEDEILTFQEPLNLLDSADEQFTNTKEEKMSLMTDFMFGSTEKRSSQESLDEIYLP